MDNGSMWELVFLIFITLITAGIFLMPFMGFAMFVSTFVNKPKPDDKDYKQKMRQIDELRPTGFIILFFGSIVFSFFLWIVSMGWHQYLDEIHHPCLQWSNPYASGQLSDSATCLLRKE